MAEVMVFRLGLELAKDLCLWEIEAEIDCLEVVNGLNHQSSNMSLFDLLIQDCVMLAASFCQCFFSHVSRNGNRVAHELAKLAVDFFDVVWVEDAPQHICNIIFLDILACLAQ